jgi:hypothetical protein
VRNLPLLKMFHAPVELYRASDAAARVQLLRKIEKDARQEGELAVDPEFFTALQQRLPRIARVEIQLKRGRIDNELTRFRYDVVLHVDDQSCVETDLIWHDSTRLGAARHFAGRGAGDARAYSRPQCPSAIRFRGAGVARDEKRARNRGRTSGERPKGLQSGSV